MEHWNTLELDVERQVRVWRDESLVVDDVFLGRPCDQVPLIAVSVTANVDRIIVCEADVELEAVVGPRSELHVA